MAGFPGCIDTWCEIRLEMKASFASLTFLLAHGRRKQCLDSVPYPPHTSPGLTGAGSVQLLSRDMTPSPHPTLHVDHSFQLAHDPSTTINKTSYHDLKEHFCFIFFYEIGLIQISKLCNIHNVLLALP